jgi:poly-gamma-glutamate synthase PgsB/CapB
MVVLAVSVAGFLLYLIYERLAVNRWRRSIPLVITVSGTRGKSTVTRLLAAVLREDVRMVMAKTTGAEAKLLWPDGSETEVRRRGVASILEQKTLLKNAARQSVDCLVAEVMSIHPENHLVESQQILKPDIVVITNFWPDHVDAQGQTENETAHCLSLDIPDEATVFAPEGSCTGVLETAVAKAGGNLMTIPHGGSAATSDIDPELARREFAGNLYLVYAVAKHIGVKDEIIDKGLKTASQDIGAFKIWEWRSGMPERRLFVVNGFAANDPESTVRVLAKAGDLLPTRTRPLVGLLCLRRDRGDRTEQWIEALKDGMANQFSRIYVSGGHAKVVARRLDSVIELTSRSPEKLMETIVSENEEGTVIFGFGNIVGMGRQLVDYWDSNGVVHGV